MSTSKFFEIAQRIDRLLDQVAVEYSSIPRSEVFVARRFREALSAFKLPGGYRAPGVPARPLSESLKGK